MAGMAFKSGSPHSRLKGFFFCSTEIVPIEAGNGCAIDLVNRAVSWGAKIMLTCGSTEISFLCLIRLRLGWPDIDLGDI